jgi:hypothetical protein
VACVVNNEQIVFAVMSVHMLEDLEVEGYLRVAVILDARDRDSVAKTCGEDTLESLDLGSISIDVLLSWAADVTSWLWPLLNSSMLSSQRSMRTSTLRYPLGMSSTLLDVFWNSVRLVASRFSSTASSPGCSKAPVSTTVGEF